MTVHVYLNTLPESVNKALLAFEKIFTYPLGSTSFHISHGPDYTRFYQAMGPAAYFVHFNKNQQITGVLSTSLIDIITQEGSEEKAAYLGDLKISPHVLKGPVLYRLFQSAQAYFTQLGIRSGMGIVMEGTERTPEQYTGRLDIPGFHPLFESYILRIQTQEEEREGSCRPVAQEEAWTLYHALTNNPKPLNPGTSSLRSNMPPTWLACQNKAVGLLEDTRRAKKLFTESGKEIISAHLSYFSFQTQKAGRALLKSALSEAQKNGFSHLFLALPSKTYKALMSKEDLPHTLTKARFYSNNKTLTGFPVNTAEI